MRALKIIGLILLSIILFFSLSVFGVLFTLDRTVLNPGFTNAEVNRLEIAALIREELTQQPPEDLPEEFIRSLTGTITRLEPVFKEKLNIAVSSVYSYLKGQREAVELVKLMRGTFLSTDFIIAVIDETDIAILLGTLVEDLVEEELPVPADVAPHLIEGLEKLLRDHEPWIKEQLRNAADPIADYIVGERTSFTISISLQPLLADLKDTLWDILVEHPIPELEGLPPALFKAEFDRLYAEITAELPGTFDIDESIIGEDLPRQVTSALTDAEKGLQEARVYVGYHRIAYLVAIILIILLIAGIVLISREVKGATRTLSIVFLLSGLVTLSGALIGKSLIRGLMAPNISDIPEQLQSWLPQMMVNLLSPLQMLGIGLLAAGAALLITSFVYKASRASQEQTTPPPA